MRRAIGALDDLEDTLKLLGRIYECKEAYDELPSNEELEETLDKTLTLLEQISECEKAYDALPSNEELDIKIAKLEKIVQLRVKWQEG